MTELAAYQSQALIGRRALLLAAVCVLAAYLASDSVLHSALRHVMSALEPVITQNPVLGVVAMVGIAALGAMIAFMSAALLVPIAVFTWGSAGTLAMLWLGWILGGLLAYGLARHFGRRVLRWCGARTLIQRCEQWVGPHTPFGLILILQLALPSEIPGYVLGLVRYPARKYLCAVALAELPYTSRSFAI